MFFTITLPFETDDLYINTYISYMLYIHLFLQFEQWFDYHKKLTSFKNITYFF